MDPKDNFLTILMPVFNGKKYIRDAIESILNQKYSDFEFLIIDDGSSDDSIDIVKSYKDARIILIENSENLGEAKTMNIGLKMATGKFIAVMHQDDVCLDNRLEEQVAFLKKNTKVAFLSSWVEIIDKDDRLIDQIFPSVNKTEIVNLFAVGDQNPFPHSSVMYDRRCVMEVGGYPEDIKYNEDAFLFLKMIQKAPFAVLPTKLVQIRHHQDQASNYLYSINNPIRVHEVILFYENAKKVLDLSRETLTVINKRLNEKRILLILVESSSFYSGFKKLIHLFINMPVSTTIYLFKFLYSSKIRHFKFIHN